MLLHNIPVFVAGYQLLVASNKTFVASNKTSVASRGGFGGVFATCGALGVPLTGKIKNVDGFLHSFDYRTKFDGDLKRI